MSSVLSKAFPSAVKEIRLHLSPVGSGSAGARKFLQNNYQLIKKNNPNLPFLVREAKDTPARLFLRLERGAERSAEIDSLEPNAIEKKIKEFLS
ncbi:hypothetical protein MBRA1_001100 [Malassezia brasiliensis]|uniref:Ribosomal protein/NADH dehydrogenase domain-containing protein n=1 Tax=Malassezia brasiliensis TaxID=1821822 RepID=A0AAF0IP36_9BASI|nr:hypothetical protein MBRA1_001100 [Malassezia brasiliensis]